MRVEQFENERPTLTAMIPRRKRAVKPIRRDGPSHRIGPPPYIYGYVRVSDKDRQENSDLVQEELVDARATRGDIVGTYVGCLVDKDTRSSAMKSNFDERAGGRWLLHHIRSGDSVIAWKIDRLGRTIGDIHKTIETLCQNGATIYLIDHGYLPVDPNGTMGRLMIAMLAAFARLENDLRRERILAAAKYRRRHGLVYCSPPPRWMQIIVRGGKKYMEPVPEQMEIIKQFKRLHDAGWTYEAIGRWAFEAGLKDANGKVWGKPLWNATWKGKHTPQSGYAVRNAILQYERYFEERLVPGEPCSLLRHQNPQP